MDLQALLAAAIRPRRGQPLLAGVLPLMADDPGSPPPVVAGGSTDAPPAATAPRWAGDIGWCPLPRSARLLFLLHTGLSLGLAGPVAGGPAGLLAATLLGAASTLRGTGRGA